MQNVSIDDDMHEDKFCFLGKIRKIFQIFICGKKYPECKALKRFMKCHFSTCFREKYVARSLLSIELLIFCCIGDKKKIIVLIFKEFCAKR